MLVMYKVIAGPCDLTATNLKMAISREGIHLSTVSDSKFQGFTTTEIMNNLLLSQAEPPHSLYSGERLVGISGLMYDL